MRRLLAVLALGAVVVACSEQATSPQPKTPAIAADYTNNPDGGGPNMLFRGDDGWGIAIWDDHYLVSFFSAPLLRCGHQFPTQVGSSQYHGDLNSFFHFIETGKTMNVYVIDLTQPVDCVAPSGSGALVGWSESGNVAVGDNEVWTGAVPVVPYYADAVRTHGTATLTTPDGGTAHVMTTLNCVGNPGNGYNYNCNNFKIKVTGH